MAAIGACLIALAGCGGGGADNSSTSVNVMVPPITTGREGVRLHTRVLATAPTGRRPVRAALRAAQSLERRDRPSDQVD